MGADEDMIVHEKKRQCVPKTSSINEELG